MTDWISPDELDTYRTVDDRVLAAFPDDTDEPADLPAIAARLRITVPQLQASLRRLLYRGEIEYREPRSLLEAVADRTGVPAAVLRREMAP